MHDAEVLKRQIILALKGIVNSHLISMLSWEQFSVTELENILRLIQRCWKEREQDQDIAASKGAELCREL